MAGADSAHRSELHRQRRGGYTAAGVERRMATLCPALAELRCPKPNRRPEPLPPASQRPPGIPALLAGKVKQASALSPSAGLGLRFSKRKKQEERGAKGKSRKRGLRRAQIC